MSKRLQSTSEDPSNKRLTFLRRIRDLRSQSQVIGRSQSLGRNLNSSFEHSISNSRLQKNSNQLNYCKTQTMHYQLQRNIPQTKPKSRN